MHCIHTPAAQPKSTCAFGHSNTVSAIHSTTCALNARRHRSLVSSCTCAVGHSNAIGRIHSTTCALNDRRHRSLASNCSTSPSGQYGLEKKSFADHQVLSRRSALLLAGLSAGLLRVSKAAAFTAPPPGYKLQRDRLDGYSFLLPESWTPLSSSGNDVFFRNPYNVNENLFVSISSPSSSRYDSIDDLRSPEAAAERTERQYVQELMSTRLGVKRTADVVSAAERLAPDGKKYYDVELEAKSYASRNQLAVSQKQIDAAMELEWDRRYITVLGVANKRLYEFRLQTAKDTYDKAKDTLQFIAQSFRCSEVET